MNKQYKPVTTDGRGFTIIEVVLVLAIAGLIFLMVFIALPALQRGQRDTQRKDDLSRINTQLGNYQSSNRGKIPAVATTGSVANFVKKYLGDNPTSMKTGDEYVDPSTGDGYTFVTGTDPSIASSNIDYQDKKICGDDGTPVSGTARNYVLRIALEGQTAPYCIDNR